MGVAQVQGYVLQGAKSSMLAVTEALVEKALRCQSSGMVIVVVDDGLVASSKHESSYSACMASANAARPERCK